MDTTSEDNLVNWKWEGLAFLAGAAKSGRTSLAMKFARDFALHPETHDRPVMFISYGEPASHILG